MKACGWILLERTLPEAYWTNKMRLQGRLPNYPVYGFGAFTGCTNPLWAVDGICSLNLKPGKNCEMVKRKKWRNRRMKLQISPQDFSMMQLITKAQLTKVVSNVAQLLVFITGQINQSWDFSLNAVKDWAPAGNLPWPSGRTMVNNTQQPESPRENSKVKVPLSKQ